MPNVFGVDGLTTATQAELLADQTAELQGIYGADINLDSDTPDGQLVNIDIQAQLDVQDLLTNINASFDPDQAAGVILDQRVAINGIVRQGGTYTLTPITVTVSQSVNLYGLDQDVQPIFTVSDNAGTLWYLSATTLALTIGANILTFRAAEPGAVLTTPNTITVPVTIVLGVTSVNNPSTYSTLGINEETDATLRVRRRKSVSLSSQGYNAALTAALENINGVTSAVVYENDTNATSDGTTPPLVPTGIPGHSIWAIVAGTPAPAVAAVWASTIEYSYGAIVSVAGTNYISIQNSNLGNLVSDTDFWQVYSPVAQAIYAKRNAGCGMRGTQSYTIYPLSGPPFVVNWDYVAAELLYIRFTVTSLDLVTPPNIAAIRAGLVTSFVPTAGQTVNINALASAVQAIDSNSLVTSAGFSTAAAGTYSNTLAPTSPAYQFSVVEANNIILSMILAGGSGTTGIGYTINSTTGVVTSTTLTIANGGTTFQFQALGGYGAYTYSVFSGSGSINGASGLFTSNAAGSTVVRVTDTQGHTADCNVTVT
jgi:hypothetical protein